MFIVKCAGCEFETATDVLLKLPLFRDDPTLLEAPFYEVQAAVPAHVLTTFLDAVADAEEVESICTEFGLQELCLQKPAMRPKLSDKVMASRVLRSNDFRSIMACCTRIGDDQSIHRYMRDVRNGCVYIDRQRKYISNTTFKGLAGIRRIEFESGIKIISIGRNAFSAQAIETIVIPASVRTIHDEAFKFSEVKNRVVSKSPLTSVIFEQGCRVLWIGARVFENTSIKTIVLPANLQYIHESAFEGCCDLESVTFEPHSRIISIGKRSFANTAISRIVIPANCVEICEHAFSLVNSTRGTNALFQSAMKSVVFEAGSQLRAVSNAFTTTRIESIVIPSNVVVLCDGAFMHDETWLPLSKSKLYSVRFEANSHLISIGSSVFSGTSIRNIVIPASVTDISVSSFSGCQITSFLTESGGQSFIGCGPLLLSYDGKVLVCYGGGSSHILIPKSVEIIKDDVFKGWSCLEVIDFEDDSQLISIGQNAFIDTHIRSIVIPASVRYICDGACGKPKPNRFRCLRNENTLRSLMFEEDSRLEYIGREAFVHSNIKSLVIPASVKRIGDGAFKVTIIESRSWVLDIDDKQREKGDFCADMRAFFTYEKVYRETNDILESVIFETGSQLMSIGKKAFQCTYINSIIVPATVKYICSEAFCGCFALNMVDFETDSQLISIRRKAFAYTNVKSLVIPAHVRNVHQLAFTGCAIVDFRVDPDNTYLIGYGSLLLSYDRKRIVCYGGHSHICIPKSVEVIEDCAFRGCTHRPSKAGAVTDCYYSYLRSVKFQVGSRLVRIGKQAFAFTNINMIRIPKRVMKISRTAFIGSNVTVFLVKAKNAYFAEYGPLLLSFDGRNIKCFGNCNDVCIPNVVERIPDHVFSDCDNLHIVRFQHNSRVLSIGREAFARSGITNIIIPVSVREIRDDAFNGCALLQSVVFDPHSQLRMIGKCAFAHTRLRKIAIPASVTHILDFGLCAQAHSERNNYNRSSFETVVFEPESQLESLGKCAFACTSVKNILIPANVTDLAASSFESCDIEDISVETGSRSFAVRDSQLVSWDGKRVIYVGNRGCRHIRIPTSVETIGSRSFHDCLHLETVDFSDGSRVISIEDEAFAYSGVVKIVIPASVVNIHKSAFALCRKLRTVEFAAHSELFSIGESAFLCTPIEEIVFPVSVKNIGSSAFQRDHSCLSNNSMAMKLVFRDGCHGMSIGENAFKNVLLKAIVIPMSVSHFDRLWFVDSIIQEFRVEHGNTSFLACGSLLLSADGKQIIYYGGHNRVRIPNSVETLQDDVFKGRSGLTEVEFEDGSRVISIGKNAFLGTSISNIVLPASVMYIHDCAFKVSKDADVAELNGQSTSASVPLTSKLIKITIKTGSTLKRIGKNAFAKTSISIMSIPASVEEICDGAFQGCGALHVVRFCKGIQCPTIARRQFARTIIERIVIPASITCIHSDAFLECLNLVVVEFEACSQLRSIERSAFAYAGIAEMPIPAYVTHIDDLAFTGCCIHEFSIDTANVSFVSDDSLLMTFDRKRVIYRGDHCPIAIQSGPESIQDDTLPRHSVLPRRSLAQVLDDRYQYETMSSGQSGDEQQKPMPVLHYSDPAFIKISMANAMRDHEYRNGRILRFRPFGNSNSEESVVFLPGMFETCSGPIYLLDRIHRCGFACFSLEIAGYDHYSGYVHRFVRFCQLVGIKRVHLIGSDAGGLDALQIASDLVVTSRLTILSVTLINSYITGGSWTRNLPLKYRVFGKLAASDLLSSRIDSSGALDKEFRAAVFALKEVGIMTGHQISTRIQKLCSAPPVSVQVDNERIMIIETLDRTMRVTDDDAPSRVLPGAKMVEMEKGGDWPHIETADNTCSLIVQHLREWMTD